MKVLFSNPPWWEQQGEKLAWHKNRLLKILGVKQKTPQWRVGVRAGSRWPFSFKCKSSPDQYHFGDYAPYPFFMGYAATYLAKSTGAEVRLRDSIAIKESYESYYDYIKKGAFDYIFLESATPSWDHDSEIIRQIHEKSPQTKIVVTGPITTVNGQQILDTLPVIACIKGEYEKNSVKVINGATGVLEYDLLTVAEMNASPFPYFDEMIAHRYWDANPRGQVFPQAQVWSSRGCPFKCIFCVWPATMTGNDPDGTNPRTVRYYSKDYMEAFLKELVAQYKFKSIYFDDDTFNLGTSHVVSMCEVMRKIGLPWSAMCRADTIKIDTWKLMKESGCFGVKLGFESGNQEVVDKIVNKHLNLEKAKEVVYLLKDLGMTVHGTFTFGLPGETPEQRLDTRRFIDSLPFDSHQASGTAEIEGTPLHTLRTKKNLEKYENAVIDSNYVVMHDGNKKGEELARTLRNS